MDKSPDYYLSWARNISQEVETVVEAVFSSKNHPEQAYKSCEGIRSLERKAGKEKLIRACRKALELNVCNYSFLKGVIENGMLEVEEDIEKASQGNLPDHTNIRGSNYYK
jgi:hypothetical protein